ncbi:MAG: hypothetical protein EOO22_21180, partial [Comamonadaceae bacterium]
SASGRNGLAAGAVRSKGGGAAGGTRSTPASRSESQQIGEQQLEQVLREAGVERVPPAAPPPLLRTAPAANPLRPLAEQVAEVERQAIQAAMEATGGNKLAAAKLLGISRAKLYERLELTV